MGNVHVLIKALKEKNAIASYAIILLDFPITQEGLMRPRVGIHKAWTLHEVLRGAGLRMGDLATCEIQNATIWKLEGGQPVLECTGWNPKLAKRVQIGPIVITHKTSEGPGDTCPPERFRLILLPGVELKEGRGTLFCTVVANPGSWSIRIRGQKLLDPSA